MQIFVNKILYIKTYIYIYLREIVRHFFPFFPFFPTDSVCLRGETTYPESPRGSPVRSLVTPLRFELSYELSFLFQEMRDARTRYSVHLVFIGKHPLPLPRNARARAEKGERREKGARLFFLLAFPLNSRARPNLKEGG